VVLEPDAVEQAVAAFRNDPNLAAAPPTSSSTATYWSRPTPGPPAGGPNGYAADAPLSFMQHFLAAAQFMEYLQAFRIGRHAEAARGQLFTLSGACGIFRREALTAVGQYHGRTVSEDTDLTFALLRRGFKLGYLPQVRVHLAPTISWRALYAQRVRWQRGELEVLAVHTDLVTQVSRSRGSNMLIRLWRDHTLAMMRLVWLLLLPLFPLLGYSYVVVAQALALMVLMYLVGDVIQLLVAYPVCTSAEETYCAAVGGAASDAVLPTGHLPVSFQRHPQDLGRAAALDHHLNSPKVPASIAWAAWRASSSPYGPTDRHVARTSGRTFVCALPPRPRQSHPFVGDGLAAWLSAHYRQ